MIATKQRIPRQDQGPGHHFHDIALLISLAHHWTHRIEDLSELWPASSDKCDNNYRCKLFTPLVL